MARYARWHIWLGWLVGVPLLLWTFSGVAMVLRPIEEVRGNDLRIERPREPLAGKVAAIATTPQGSPQAIETHSFVQRGRPVTLVTRRDESLVRYDAATGTRLEPVDETEARAAVASAIRGGDNVTKVELFPADRVPLDFRKPVAAWRVTLADGTYVYVSRDSGEIEGVRTRWWRIYDFLWGIHIMDLQTREDAHNPFTIAFGIIAFLGALLGFVLLFRRRKARPTA